MESKKELCVDGKPLSTLRVVDLKQELEKRGISKSGSKKELIDKLKVRLELEALQHQEPGEEGGHVPNLALKDDLESSNDFVKAYLADQQATYQKQIEIKQQIMSETVVAPPPTINQEHMVPAPVELSVQSTPGTSADKEEPEHSSAAAALVVEQKKSPVRQKKEKSQEQHVEERRESRRLRGRPSESGDDSRLSETKKDETDEAERPDKSDAAVSETKPSVPVEASKLIKTEVDLPQPPVNAAPITKKEPAETKKESAVEKVQELISKTDDATKVKKSTVLHDQKPAASLNLDVVSVPTIEVPKAESRSEDKKTTIKHDETDGAAISSGRSSSRSSRSAVKAEESKAQEVKKDVGLPPSDSSRGVKDEKSPSKLKESGSKHDAVVKKEADKNIKVASDQRSVAPTTSELKDEIEVKVGVAAKPTPKKSSADSKKNEDETKKESKDAALSTASDKATSHQEKRPERKRRWGSSKGDTSGGSGRLNRGLSSDSIKGLITEKAKTPGSEVSANKKANDSQKSDSKVTEQSTAHTPIQMSANLSGSGQSSGAPSSSALEDGDKRENFRVVRTAVSDERSGAAKLSAKEKRTSNGTVTSATTRIRTSKPEEEVAQREPSPAKNPASAILFIRNLTRPFTLNQLYELLSKDGSLVKENFWIDKIKSMCYATYACIEEATKMREELHGLRWPEANPKTLNVDFAAEQDVEDAKNPPVKESPAPLKPLDNREVKLGENEEIVVRRSEGDGEKSQASKRPVREWDREKFEAKDRDVSPTSKRRRSRSPVKGDTEGKEDRRGRGDAKDSAAKPGQEPGSPAKMLDDLFKKTKATPSIYWLPLTEEQAVGRTALREENDRKRKEERDAREAERDRRMEEAKTRRFSPPARRGRSPFFGGGGPRGSPRGRGRSPMRRGPPMRDRRSPVRRRRSRSSSSGSRSRSRSPARRGPSSGPPVEKRSRSPRGSPPRGGARRASPRWSPPRRR